MSSFYPSSIIIMKKYILLVSLLLLTSCFWIFWWSSEDSGSGLVLSDNSEFSILVPSTWVEMSKNSLPSPKSWSVALALKSQNERQWYTNNLIILKSENTPDTNSRSLMESTESLLKKDLQSFALTSKREFSFSDNDTAVMLNYRAKYNPWTTSAQYIQTAKLCGDTSYFMTISVWEALEDYRRYEQILETFRCN